jgi:hypothetical protein
MASNIEQATGWEDWDGIMGRQAREFEMRDLRFQRRKRAGVRNGFGGRRKLKSRTTGPQDLELRTSNVER